MINIYIKKEKCSQKAESAVRHAIALRGAGWPGVCVCRASAGGNRSYPDLLERPQQRWWCWVPRCAQQQPSSAHSSAAKAEAELFGARRGDSTEAELVFPPDKVGRWGCDVLVWSWGFGPELESGSDQVCPMCHRSNSGLDCSAAV